MRQSVRLHAASDVGIGGPNPDPRSCEFRLSDDQGREKYAKTVNHALLHFSPIAKRPLVSVSRHRQW